MTEFVPRGMFLTKGVGSHREELHSFELALRNAGIEKCNLVQVSSILPPGCVSFRGGRAIGADPARRHHLLRHEPLLQQ